MALPLFRLIHRACRYVHCFGVKIEITTGDFTYRWGGGFEVRVVKSASWWEEADVEKPPAISFILGDGKPTLFIPASCVISSLSLSTSCPSSASMKEHKVTVQQINSHCSTSLWCSHVLCPYQSLCSFVLHCLNRFEVISSWFSRLQKGNVNPCYVRFCYLSLLKDGYLCPCQPKSLNYYYFSRCV